MTAELGTVRRYPYDSDGFERRERLSAVADCPECGREVECWADIEEWTETSNGVKQHSGYGPAQGVCEMCHLLIVDSWDGCEVYDLGEPKEKR